MRVQPHLPSNPLVATTMASFGSARWACSAAKRPAPPEPRIRISVVARSIAMAPHCTAFPKREPYQAIGVRRRVRDAGTNPLPPPPSSPAPARTIIDSRAVISRAIHDGRWRVVARRSVDDWRLIALGVAGWWPIGSRLPRSAGAEVSGDRIAAVSVPRHLAPLAAATCDPDRASGRNGRDDLRVRSWSAAQIDGGGDRGRPCATSTNRRLTGGHGWAILRLRVRYPFLLRYRRTLLRTSRCHHCRSRNDAQRRAERSEMERHDNSPRRQTPRSW